MGHNSRVCAVLFDTKDADYAATVEFWSGALGRSYELSGKVASECQIHSASQMVRSKKIVPRPRFIR